MQMIFHKLKERWSRPVGYREILTIAFPLILSTSAWSIQHFVDRMFLTWYSPEAIAAAVPSGVLNFSFMSLFIGTAGYVGTFVAQYYGAHQNHRIGPILWQGIYFAVVAGILLQFWYPWAPAIFKFAGHSAEIQKLEVVYFQILLFGAAPVLIANVASAYFTGLGKTWPVMWVNVSSIFVNLFLDYLMIFGHWGVPEMGMAGAAIATVIAGFYSAAIFLYLLFREEERKIFCTLAGWRFEWDLFKRLMYYGFPNGMQFLLDTLGFSIFLILVGRLGTASLAATNIAFNINSFAFMPMLGLGTTVTILVGQSLGKDDVVQAEKCVWTSFELTFFYMAVVALLYVVVPELFLWPFSSKMDAAAFQEIYDLTVKLLIFVAFYSLFDTMNIIFAGAIKGAGDTRFVMILSIFLAWLLMVLPTYISCIIYGKNLFWAWSFASFYIIVLGLVFLLRFLSGKWKTMRVIEEKIIPLTPVLPELPTLETEL